MGVAIVIEAIAVIAVIAVIVAIVATWATDAVKARVARAKVKTGRAMVIGAETGNALNAAPTILPEETIALNAAQRSLNKHLCRRMHCNRGVFQPCFQWGLA